MFTLEEETGKLFGGLWTSLNDQQYLAGTETEKYLTRLAHATSMLYVDFAEKALADETISNQDLREIIIGEGNYRIVVTKT